MDPSTAWAVADFVVHHNLLNVVLSELPKATLADPLGDRHYGLSVASSQKFLVIR
jgi:hypothetical protein